MGRGQSRGGERKAVPFPEAQGHRWLGLLVGVLPLQGQSKRGGWLQVSRSNRIQAPGFQFGSKVHGFSNPPIPSLSRFLNLMRGNSKEINLRCENEVTGGQGNRVLQKQNWEKGQPAHS